MSIVILNDKGQVTIPQDVRAKLKIGKGDPLILEVGDDGAVHLRPAAVFPIESYSEQRIKEFEKEDALTPEQKLRLKKAMHG